MPERVTGATDGYLAAACFFVWRAGLGGLFPALRRLRAEPLGEPLHAPFGIHELLPAREERMAVVADLEVQLGLGRAGLPRGAAGAPRLDVEVLRVNPFLHSSSFRGPGKPYIVSHPVTD